MRWANRSDRAGVPRSRQPAVNGGTDSPADQGRIAGAGVTGDQQDHPVAASDRTLESAVDGIPRRIEAVPVKVDDLVRLNRPSRKPTIPTAIQAAPDPAVSPRFGLDRNR